MGRMERKPMKPKTFKYNQIVQFFIENKMPLTLDQVQLIASKVKEEMTRIESHREKRLDKRLKRKTARNKVVSPLSVAPEIREQ